MPCGPQLIEAVEAVLMYSQGSSPAEIKNNMGSKSKSSLRAIRYAITELIKQGRAKRDGRQGAVYAVRAE